MGQILKSLTPAYGGYSIARDEKVIFIKGAIPGEVVEVEIEERKRDYSVASSIRIVEASEHRVEPVCRVFGRCGGCHLQFISYDRQLGMKEEILLDTLGRLGKIEISLSDTLSDAQWNYRQRAQFKVSKAGEIGFFRESSRDVVASDDGCPLMDPSINLLLAGMKEKDLARGLSDIHVAAGETPVVFLKGKDFDLSSCEAFVDAGFSGIAYNDGIAYGGAYTGFDLNGLRYTVSPWTFFQAHWSLNRRVVAFMVEQMAPLEGRSVLDLYAGAGNFSLPVAVHAGEVIAVEENASAVEDGARNIELNGIRNCRIVKSSAEKYRFTKKFDVIILDPPRPGLTSEVAKKIIENPADQIVYISCNPATLARDLKKLKEKYEVESVRLIDFFPNTYHIEAMAFLRVK
jgi:23S rRNA (uracil1939-C5)-methyltransferase